MRVTYMTVTSDVTCVLYQLTAGQSVWLYFVHM